MIRYDWNKVCKASDRESARIMDIIEYITDKRIPANQYDMTTKYMQATDWSGDSFILNPEPLIEHRDDYSDKDLAEYVGLASFRNLAEYLTTKQKSLPVQNSPVRVETFKDNKLLSVENDHIHFCWEEVH